MELELDPLDEELAGVDDPEEDGFSDSWETFRAPEELGLTTTLPWGGGLSPETKTLFDATLFACPSVEQGVGSF